MNVYSKVAMGIWIATLPIAVNLDPWPAILATFVFLSLYMESALGDRAELKQKNEALERASQQSQAQDRDYEKLREQVNAISLKLGLRLNQ